MQMEPRFTIVIPAYNAAEFIVRAVRSVQDQTVTDWHLVIVDDGSTDNTSELAHSAASKDDRITVVYQPNQGMGSARNYGYGFASPASPYVLFLDADDELFPDALEVLSHALDAVPDAPAAAGACQLIDRHGNSIPPPDWQLTELPLRIEPTLFDGEGNRLLTPGAALLRRTAYEKTGGWANFTEHHCEDLLLMVQLACQNPLVGVQQQVCRYRRHPGQWTADSGRVIAAIQVSLPVIRRLIADWRAKNAEPVTQDGWVEDPLRVVRAKRHPGVVARYGFLTVASAGWENWLDRMLASLHRNGGIKSLEDSNRQNVSIIVFNLGDSPAVRAVAAQYGAVTIPTEFIAPQGSWSKSIVYAASSVLPGIEIFLCLDSDIIIKESLMPLLETIHQLSTPSVLVARDGNGILPPEPAGGRNLRNYSKVFARWFSDSSENMYKIMGLDGHLGDYGLPINDGVFMARREGLLAVEQKMRQMYPAMQTCLDSGQWWYNQLIFNVALAHLQCAVELHGTYNVQLHAVASEVEYERNGKARWRGESVKILHYTAWSKSLF